ncbi:MAG TPA: histidine kinase dimerization/phospho-acceptor domain-containing protein, partial [Telluria sp.]|nr:histidine kinase dimerization/phospho-acceptor domain-containing protein [Telluria sp.]
MHSGTTAQHLPPDAQAFRAIAELAGDAGFIIDPAAHSLHYLSPSVEQLLGYVPAVFAAAVAGGDEGAPLSALCDGIFDATGRVAREVDIRRPDGTVAAVEIITQRVDGVLVGLIRDLSGQRALQAEQKRFASMLNHEFRTPLSTIDGAIQRLEATSAHADDATRQRYRKIGAAVDRLVGMLDQYLSPDRMAAIGKQKQA